MKVVLFTHSQDIDGIGNIILGKLAFSELDTIPCKTFEITEKVSQSIEDKTIYNYDFIFITDLCIQEPLLSKINQDPILKNKLLIFDHHKSEIEVGNNKYPFVYIIVENEFGKTSGTSIFYQYLTSNHLLKRTAILDEFVELTRQYDTWEWQTKYHNPKARQLHILLEELGYPNYIEIMLPILQKKTFIEFTKEQENIMKNFDDQLSLSIPAILKKMKIYEETINEIKYRIGFITIPYKYRNEFDEIIMKDNQYNIDAIGMIITDTNTISYRRIKNIDVSKIGIYFGGKGHKNAATNSQNHPRFIKVLKKINQNKMK